MSTSPEHSGSSDTITPHSGENIGGPLSRLGSENAEVSDAADVAQGDNQTLTTRLPFSTARCIALVATLAGAAFLNVSDILQLLVSHTIALWNAHHRTTDRACRVRPW